MKNDLLDYKGFLLRAFYVRFSTFKQMSCGNTVCFEQSKTHSGFEFNVPYILDRGVESVDEYGTVRRIFSNKYR